MENNKINNSANSRRKRQSTSRLYGYNYIKEENKLDIIEKEAKVIRLIFNLYSKNYGIRKILKELRDKEIKTREDKDFSKAIVSKILEEEKYCGVKNSLKSDNTGLENIPPIISLNLYNKCKEIRNLKVDLNQKENNKDIDSLAGKIKCGNCGAVYYRNSDRGEVFYNCSNKRINGTKVCNNPNVSLEKIESFKEKAITSSGDFEEQVEKFVVKYNEKTGKTKFKTIFKSTKEV